MNVQNMTRHIAEAVREACLKAAQEAYENAGISGLCDEGRWECAVDAIQALDLEAAIARLRSDLIEAQGIGPSDRK